MRVGMQWQEQADINTAGESEVLAVTAAAEEDRGGKSDRGDEKEDSRDGAPENSTSSELKYLSDRV